MEKPKTPDGDVSEDSGSGDEVTRSEGPESQPKVTIRPATPTVGESEDGLQRRGEWFQKRTGRRR